MKKSILIAALIFFALAGCSKADPIAPAPTQDGPRVTLNLTVAPKDAFGTKAIKTAWEDGDYLYLFFAPEGSSSYSDLKGVVVKRNEGAWEVDSESQEALDEIASGGKVLAIYTQGAKRTIEADAINGLLHLGNATDNPANPYGLTMSQETTYTFSSNAVTATLYLERKSQAQITVTGISNDTDNQWALYSCGTGAASFSGTNQLSVKYDGSGFDSSTLIDASKEEVLGANNGSDAVTFYITGIDYATKSVRLLLHNTKTGKNYVRILDSETVEEDNAYTIPAPALDSNGDIDDSSPWYQGFLIEYTAPSEWTAPTSYFVAAEKVATGYNSGTGYVIFKSGCPNFAFYYNSAVTSAAIQKGVSSIGNCAFSNCYVLENIDLPSTITTIGTGALDRCVALKEIDLPSELETIDENAFYYCSALEVIDLPSGLKTINSQAFYLCTKLANVICRPLTPPTLGDSVFSNCDKLEKIKVPAASVTSYKNAKNWSDYDTIIDSIDE